MAKSNNTKTERKEEVVMKGLDKKAIDKIVNASETKGTDGYMSKSQKVIALGLAGYEVKEIYQILINVLPRYQMAFNVWSNYCRMNGIERVVRDKSDTKKAQIIERLEKGMEPVNIAKELMCHQNMVYKIRKEWEMDQRNQQKEKEA